jgi:esterase
MQLNYKILGEGEPIIFLHGLFGMLDNWQTFGRQIAELGYKVILVDQRDHGKSPWTNEFNYQILADDIIEFADQLNLNNYVLVGHSMGGKTAMKVAQLAPESLIKLVIVDVAPKKYRRGHDNIFESLKSLDLENAKSRNDLYDGLKHQIDEEMVVQFLLKNIQRNSEGPGFSIKFNIDLLEQWYESIIDDVHLVKPVEVETLFCRGELSNYIMESDYQKIYEFFPNSHIETIKNAGHWLHAEQPDILFQVMKTFLSK